MLKFKQFLFSKGLLIVLFIIGMINHLCNYFFAFNPGTAFVSILSLLISIPIYIIMFKKIKKVDALKNIPIGLKILSLLFCSFLGGILLLAQRSDGQKIPKTKMNPSISTARKVCLILLHTVTLLMIWCVPCVRYGRLSWDGLEGSESTSLGSAIAGFSSYDSSEASTLLVLLVSVHICAVLFLVFSCIGKHKPPMLIFSSCTVGFTCLLNLIANSYETFKITVSDSFWGASVATYNVDDSVSFTVLVAIVTLVVSFVMILRRSETNVMSTFEDTPISATEPAPTSITAPTSVQTLEERLTQLNDLKARGLITEEEYNEKKQSILSEL